MKVSSRIGCALLTLAVLLLQSACVSTNKGWARAANAGATAEAARLIGQGKGLDSTDAYRDDALFWAVRNNRAELVDQLLSGSKFKVNALHPITGETVLMYAAKAGNQNMVKRLLALGANANLKDRANLTAADWAAKNNHPDLYAQLSGVIANNNAVGADNTTLVAAIHSRNLATVKLAAARAPSLDAPDSYGDTPFVAAAKIGDLAISQWLIEQGADLQRPDRLGRSPFILAVQAGHIGIVGQLLAQGFKVTEQAYLNHSALLFAVVNGQAEMVQLLLEQGANPEAVSPEAPGYAAIMLAAQAGHTAVVNLLLDAGVSVNHQHSTGQSPLILAAAGGYAGLVNLLLERGARHQLLGAGGKSALGMAARTHRWAIVVRLLDAGAEISEADREALDADHHTAAPYYLTAAEYQLQTGQRSDALGLFELAHSAMSKVVQDRKADVRWAGIEAVTLAVGQALKGSLQTYAANESARVNADQNARLSALAGSSSPEEYSAKLARLRSINQRSAAVDERAADYSRFDWLGVGQPLASGGAKQRLALAETALMELETTIACVRQSLLNGERVDSPRCAQAPLP